MDASVIIRQPKGGRVSPSVVGYLASLDQRRTVLWGALLWYLVIEVRYGERALSGWAHSLGIAAIVGVILTLNAVPRGGRVRDLGFWAVLRFFLIPFCVASFSTSVRGHAFVLVFPMNAAENLAAGGLIALFCVLVWVAKRRRTTRTPQKLTTVNTCAS